jgi:hypothetical protein
MAMTAMGIGLLQVQGKPDLAVGGGAQLPIPVTELEQFIQAPLGFTHLEPASSQMALDSSDVAYGSGDRTWIYVYNGSGADLPPATACSRGIGVIPGTTGSNPGIAVPSSGGAASAAILGVTQYPIPDGFCGFILRKGAGVVNMTNPGGAGITTNPHAPVVPAAPGELTEGGPTDDACGVVISATAIGAGDTEPVGVLLNCNG